MSRLAFLVLAAACAASARADAGAGSAASAPAFSRARVAVRDLRGAADWLNRVLAWTPTYRSESRVVYSSAAAPLELDAAESDAAVAVVLVSRDADADYAKLLERGAVSIAAPADRPSGFREASVKGPGALTFVLEGPLASPAEFVFTELQAGTGASPRPEDTVKVRYVGSLADGTVFDGAHRTGRALMIPLPSAIRCWTLALPRMKAGGRARFACPAATAYGRAGRPPVVPPDAPLTFEVELVGVLR